MKWSTHVCSPVDRQVRQPACIELNAERTAKLSGYFAQKLVRWEAKKAQKRISKMLDELKCLEKK
jgi:hypothetical protein